MTTEGQDVSLDELRDSEADVWVENGRLMIADPGDVEEPSE